MNTHPVSPRLRLLSALPVLAAFAAGSLTTNANGDDAACEAKFVEGQTLQKDGKLIEANAAFKACALETCGALRSKACNTKHLAVQDKIPSVMILAMDGATPMTGITATMDDAPIAAQGVAVEVNPGPHKFVFRTTDGRVKTLTSQISEGKTGQEVRAVFEPVAPPIVEKPTEVGTTDTTATKTTVVAQPETPPPESSSPLGTIGPVVAGVGLVSVGLGTVLVLGAKSKANGADCDANNLCRSQSGVDDRNSAIASARLGSAFMIVGALAAVGGVVLWLSAPKPTESSVAVGVAANQLTLSGRF